MQQNNKLIAILTPTYNRAMKLKTLFASLQYQKTKNFIWYIIDDGSTDETQQLVKNFPEDNFKIKYFKKQNGGKHTALNYGVRLISEELIFIVDSDDYLTDDATTTIEEDWKKYKSIEKLVGLSYYRLDKSHKIIGGKYGKYENKVANFIEVRINNNLPGDKAEIWKTNILKKYPFPEFEGEHFLSEAVVWNAIAVDNYVMAFIPKGVYICEYLAGGLTRGGRRLRLENPLGTLMHAKSYFDKKVCFKVRIKYYLYYSSVAIYSNNLKRALKEVDGYNKVMVGLLIPVGYILSSYWKEKYK